MAVARDAYAQQTLGVNLMERLNKVRAHAGVALSLPVRSPPGGYLYRSHVSLRGPVRSPSFRHPGPGPESYGAIVPLELLG